MTKNASILTDSSSSSEEEDNDDFLPILKKNEVGLHEKILGSGGFCEVSAVRWINVSSHQQQQQQQQQQQLPCDCTNDFINARGRFGVLFKDYKDIYISHDADDDTKHNGTTFDKSTDNSTSSSTAALKPPQVALKKVKSTLKKDRYQIGTKDLLVEASALKNCNHPNIISLYAVGCKDDVFIEYSANNDCSAHPPPSKLPEQINFIMIDQLQYTLRKRITLWKAEKGIGPKWMKSKKNLDKLWIDRMMVIKQIADAIYYLHKKGFVHRDVTADNIGFASNDLVKLFDFGLVKSIHTTTTDTTTHVDEDNDIKDDNQVFDFTANTGTLRYMSPEVALGMPYGLKTDIYSFSLVIYEILKLSKAFARIIEPSMFTRMVIKGDFRPTLDNELPLVIKDLLQRMWSSDVPTRPSAKEVVESLQQIFRGEEYNLFPSKHERRFQLFHQCTDYESAGCNCNFTWEP